MPEQLPIVLQVLLSQQHRLRALVLLGRFLDLGPWAVNAVSERKGKKKISIIHVLLISVFYFYQKGLFVGIFPYVLKLLTSPVIELRQILVFIWCKILALDRSCQVDLIKENGRKAILQTLKDVCVVVFILNSFFLSFPKGHSYFISIVGSPTVQVDQRVMSLFILSVICSNFRPGQTACLSANLLQLCLMQLKDHGKLLDLSLSISISFISFSFLSSFLSFLCRSSYSSMVVTLYCQNDREL
jgi:regulator-associated protein of mTOR